MTDKWWILALSLSVMGPSHGLTQTNGLAGADRDTWYHLSQGTEFFPLRFLLALNDADSGEPFMKDLERFGFVPDPKGPNNPHGLPVGMTADPTRDLRFRDIVMVGINCAACHTAVLEFGGRPILRADGGTNMFDAERFRSALMRSAQKTIDNPIELVAFVSRLVRQPRHVSFDAKEVLFTGPLAKKVGERIEKVFDAVDGPEKRVADKLHDLIRQELQEKPFDLTRGLVTRPEDPKLQEATSKVNARIKSADAMGSSILTAETLLEAAPFGEVITSLRLLRARLEALKVGGHPIMTPPGFGRVDAFGGARNTLFPDKAGPLDAPVRYPFIWTIKDTLTWYHWDGNTKSRLERNTGEALGVGAVIDTETFESTIRFGNLASLEQLAMRLQPPVWPKEFGETDPKKAAEGAKHFKKFCAKCHEGPKADGFIIDSLTTLKTDPRRVQNVRRTVGGVRFFDAQSPILKATIRQAGLQVEGDKNVWRPSKDLEPKLPEGYANRPLPAVWASPPYLHNGSVPNLYQLLLSAEKRDKTFSVGHREYDPEHLGYTLKPARTMFLFDTRRPGNSNSGHSGPEYGTTCLTDDQRWELIEYLKTH